MAEALDDGEFWLPSEFLSDNDILMEARKGLSSTTHGNSGGGARFCFPSEFPYGFSSYGSNNSPPVDESLLGSNSESDEEDYLAGFTREMARSLLTSTIPNPKRVMAGSPESPLCGMGSWSFCSAGSSRGSPNGPSQVSSPPETPLNAKDDAWELLFAAAGEMVKMKLEDERLNYGTSTRGLLGAPRHHTLPSKNNSNVGCYSNQALAHHQLQANHFYQLKQQQQQQQQQLSTVWARQVKPNLAPQQQQVVPQGARSVGYGNGRSTSRPLGLPPSAWPPLQQQQQQQQHNGSGMRAVFLGGSGGTRRESSGTGVFLPRRNGVASDTRRKPACSSVLLPARVVQALNRSFDDMNASGGAQQRFVGGLGGHVHGNALLSHQQHKKSFRPQPAISTEVQLPQEWTY